AGTVTHAIGVSLSATAQWYVDGVLLTSGVTWNSLTDVTLTMPAHGSGDVSVEVVNPGGLAYTIGGAFTYMMANTIAWFRASEYDATAHVLHDISGGGLTVPLGSGSPVPALTTLGGQPALDMSGGCFFQNTIANILTAGGVGAVLLVGKGASGGGSFFSIRRSAPSLDVQLYEYFGNTIALGDEATSNVIMTESGPAYVGIPFASAHVLNGSGNVPSILIENVAQTITGGHQATESGSNGFTIGTNPGGQPWNGIIAEIIVLSVASTEDFFV
ncbi:MAG: hypothetical protein ABI551_06115, partial [Polyangiaceae bacterium]